MKIKGQEKAKIHLFKWGQNHTWTEETEKDNYSDGFLTSF